MNPTAPTAIRYLIYLGLWALVCSATLLLVPVHTEVVLDEPSSCGNAFGYFRDDADTIHDIEIIDCSTQLALRTYTAETFASTGIALCVLSAMSWLYLTCRRQPD